MRSSLWRRQLQIESEPVHHRGRWYRFRQGVGAAHQLKLVQTRAPEIHRGLPQGLQGQALH